jgi:LysR family transcriptional regulator for metE and metH
VRDLQLVLALASAGSTSKAAAVLHLSQPAVSRALLLAEQKVGTKLFERTGRGLAATPAGERLVAGAGPLLAELADLEHRAGSAPAGSVRVRMVCECYTAYRWLPSALTSLAKNLPGLEVDLAVEHTSAPVPALLDGKIDVALVTTSRVRSPLQEAPLFSDEIVFVMSKDHALASKKAITRKDLRESTLLGSTSTPLPEARSFFLRVFRDPRPRLTFIRFPLTEAIIDAARAGMGVAVLSEWIAGPYVGDGALVVKRLAGGPLRRLWRIAFRRESADAAERLRRVLAPTAPRLPAS